MLLSDFNIKGNVTMKQKIFELIFKSENFHEQCFQLYVNDDNSSVVKTSFATAQRYEPFDSIQSVFESVIKDISKPNLVLIDIRIVQTPSEPNELKIINSIKSNLIDKGLMHIKNIS